MARRQQSGFTLIEVLMTMAVIGLAIAVATLSIGGTRNYEINNALKQFTAQANLVLEEAILQNREYGLLLDVDNQAGFSRNERYRYDWLVFDAEKRLWLTVEEHDVLSGAQFPAELKLEMTIEGQPVIIGAEKEAPSWFGKPDDDGDSKNKDEKPLIPDVYFMSSGEVVAFELSVTDLERDDTDAQFKIIGEMVGRIRLLQPGDEEL